MYLEDQVVWTKLAPPRPVRRALARPRLTQRISQALDYRLTLIQAGAGYGKTTALAPLAEQPAPLVWYHIDAEDADPLVFLLYLLYGFYGRFPHLSEAPLALLEARERRAAAVGWSHIVDALINELAQNVQEPTLLVLDDAHLLKDVPEAMGMLERLLRHGPANLHLVLATRHPLKLDGLVVQRVRGEVLDIGEDELAFTPDEIQHLFHESYGIDLSDEQVQLLAAETEGWAIALQLVWQGLRGGDPRRLPAALRGLSGVREDLFTYLAHEVLDQQLPEVQRFLLTTSCLRRLTPAACDALHPAGDSRSVLQAMLDGGLFLVELGVGTYRYHHLFREFLYHQLSEEERRAVHWQAAAHFASCDAGEEAVHHYLRARAFGEAAALIGDIGRGMMLAGRLETMAGWLGELPPETLAAHPALLTYHGDIARLHSRFDEALRWYRQAEERCRWQGDVQGVARALRGQARVYLDTVNPSGAEAPLREALRLADGQQDREARASLLELLAENQLNRGRAEQAKRLQEEAHALRDELPDEAVLDVRVLLRTGRLAEARQALGERVAAERLDPVLRPRAHRETLLLLSLIQCYLGEAEAAYANAVAGTERGETLNSPFVTAVGHMRQGHAWLIGDDPDRYAQAERCFQRTIEIGEQISVARLKVEADWGLCRVYGQQGRLAQAEAVAREGIEIGTRAGDEWVTAYIRVAMGSGYVLAGRYDEALPWLARAETDFRECGDDLGVAAARLWLCLAWYERGDEVRFAQGIDDLLGAVRSHGYEFLLTRRTLAGLPEPSRAVPLLIAARGREQWAAYAGSLLARMGLAGIEFHPGYTLRVQALGAFKVWRGVEEVEAGDWQRDKARQLFQLLLTHRRTTLDRDKICGILWPELDEDSANQSFKVALNALYRALEPGRGRAAPSAYVERRGALYGLRPTADLWLDAEQFEQAVARGDALFHDEPQRSVEPYRRALALYTGDYLEEFPYEDWLSRERIRLRELYLRSADRLARVLAQQGEWEAVLEVCRQILACDNCWEHAYRLMMIAYTRLGHRPHALRVYQRAVEALREELDADVSYDTVKLYESIVEQVEIEGGEL